MKENEKKERDVKRMRRNLMKPMTKMNEILSTVFGGIE